MKKFIPILFLLFTFDCFAQTQAEMSKDAYEMFQNADKDLNEVYNQILSDYKKDTIFIENLKKAQRLWVQFRDAELNMKFPAYPDNQYGSMLPMCRAFYLEELTKNRTETLRAWLNNEELTACNGSVHTK